MEEKLENLKAMTRKVSKLGGVGAPNVGTEEWKQNAAKLQKRQEFGNVAARLNHIKKP